MTHSIQEITAKISVFPERIQQGVLDFIEFMHAKFARHALAVDWNRAEEDNVWRSFQWLYFFVSAKASSPSI